MMVNANELHVFGSQNRLFHGLSDVAVTDNRDSCLHIFYVLKRQKYKNIQTRDRKNVSLHPIPQTRETTGL
jgi:hypothetical protein